MQLLQQATYRTLLGFLPLFIGFWVALVIIIALLSLENLNPADVWDSLYAGAWGRERQQVRVLNAMLPLLLCSTGLLITFSAGLWNIGIEGQLMMGALGATLGALFLDMGDQNTQIAVQFALAMAAGGSWGLLAGILKTRGGVNEIFGGVALNFIAAAFASFLIAGPWAPERGGTGSRTGSFPPEALLSAEIIDGAPRSELAVQIAFGSFVIIALMLWFSRFGLQIKAMGRNADSAKALGLPIERNTWLAMGLCGVLAGLAGTILVAYPPIGQLQAGESGGIGFAALLVVLLAAIRPLLVPPIVFVFAFLSIGSVRLQSQAELDPSFVDVLQGILVLVVLLFDGFRQRIEAANARRAIAAQAARRAGES